MSDTIQLEALDEFEEDTLVDLHLTFAPTTPGSREEATRVLEFAELAKLLDAKAVSAG